MTRDEKVIRSHSQGETRPKDFTPRGSTKHHLNMGTRQVHTSGRIHVRARELTHAGKLST